MHDYYLVLSINGDANAKQIKDAYLGLCKEFHPDVSSSRGSEEKFKLVQEAYSVLSSNAKRANYDMEREQFARGVYPPVRQRRSGPVHTPHRPPRTGAHKLLGFEAALGKGGWLLLGMLPILAIAYVGISTLSSDVTKYDRDEDKVVRGT